jgi:hypothetical protein
MVPKFTGLAGFKQRLAIRASASECEVTPINAWAFVAETDPTSPIGSPNRARGWRKLFAISVLIVSLLSALIGFVSHETVNGLRHHLTLWLILAIVMIINITSFLIFALLLAAYKWIRRDFVADADD